MINSITPIWQVLKIVDVFVIHIAAAETWSESGSQSEAQQNVQNSQHYEG